MIKDKDQKFNTNDSQDNELIKTLLSIEDILLASSSSDPRLELYKLIVCRYYQIKNDIRISNFNQLSLCLVNSLLTWQDLSLESSFNAPEDIILECFKKIEKFYFSKDNLSIMEYIFEYLSTKTAKGDKGQFFTPRYVIKELVKILPLEKKNLFIADPACGSGGFLSIISQISGKANYLYGFDYDAFAIKTAKITAMLMETEINYLQINSLVKKSNNLFNNHSLCIEDYMKTRHKNFDGFDIVTTNPPFGGIIKDKELIQQYSISNYKNSTRDILFIEKCFDLLKNEGKLIIVLPNSFFVDSNLKFQREWLLTHFKINGILSLHPNTFLPHTHQKTSVLFATKKIYKTIPQDEKIVFSIAEKPGKDTKGKYIYKNNNIDTDLSEAVKIIHF